MKTDGTDAALRRLEQDLRPLLYPLEVDPELHAAVDLLLIAHRIRTQMGARWLLPAALLWAVYRAGVVVGQRKAQ